MMILAERLMVVDVTRRSATFVLYFGQQKQYLLRTNIDKVVMHKGK